MPLFLNFGKFYKCPLAKNEAELRIQFFDFAHVSFHSPFPKLENLILKA